eukprot:tig00020878_g14856.t1
MPASAGFGAAMAALTKEVVLTITDDLPNSKPLYKRFPIDRSLEFEFYSALVNLSSTDVKRVVKRTFVLGAITTAGYNKDEEGSNTVKAIDQPCEAGLSCPADLLDDIFVECPQRGTNVSASLGVLPELCSAEAFAGGINASNMQTICANTTDPLPAPIMRRRALSAFVTRKIDEEIRNGRMLLADEGEFSSDAPPTMSPDDDFEITTPLPIEETLALAADKTSLPEDETALAINIAAEGGGCGPGPVVLDISYETPYDVNILVAPSLGLNDTELGAALPSKDTPIIFSRSAAAFEFAYARVGSFGRPIGIFLEATDYVKNGTSDLWYAPEPIPGAEGSKVWALRGAGGAIVVGSAQSSAGEVSFQGCYFTRNEAFSGGDPALDPQHRFGGALALVRANSVVTVNGTNFDSNTADAAGAIWVGTAARISSSQIGNSLGGGLHVSNAEVALDTVIVSDSFNLINADAGGGLTCTGSSAKLTVTTSSFSSNIAAKTGGAALIQSGCSASFYGTQFEKNGAIMGGGVAVGELDPSEASSAPTDAGSVSFTKCVFLENIAGGVDPSDPVEIGGQKLDLPTESSMGGGLAVFGASSPVRIEQCVFRKNEAFMGGGLFSADAIDITGETSGFDENTAGFSWYKDADLEPTQIGGGALIMMTAGRRGGVVRINKSLFFRNSALGAFGGGIAVIGASIKFEGTLFIQNQVKGDSSQGGGLYVQASNVTEGSDYIATSNAADGIFKNVFLADEAIAVVDAESGAQPSSANMKSCYQCTPCQICGVKTGRCQFPPNLEEWCKFTNSCNKESCPFVTIGAATFDQRDFTSISIEIDIPYTINSDGTTSSTIPCSSAIAAETLPLLGRGVTCKLTGSKSSGSGAGRRRTLLGPTGNQLVVNLGAGFTVAPGSTLYMLTGGMPSQYAGLSDAAIVQIGQVTLSRSVVESNLQIANGTITAAFTSTSDQGGFLGRGSSGARWAARASQGLGHALLLLLVTLAATLLATFL